MYAIRRSKKKLNSWCWEVSFIRRRKSYHKMFFDGTHGGSEKALAAAIKWRDAALAKIKVLTYREFHQHKRSNNTSGVPGVHFLRPKRSPDGVWQAKIKPKGGRAKHRTFSVSRFGYRGAYRRAVKARMEMLQALEDRPYIKHPTAKRLALRLG